MKKLNLASMFRDSAKDLPTGKDVPATVLENRRRRALARLQDALASRGSGTDTVPPELERGIRQLLRKWARQSFADGFEEMEGFEIRCAREHDLVVAQASGNREVILRAQAADYRRRVVEQFGRIELRGIQTSERGYPKLNEVFVPLYLAEPTSPIFNMPQMTQELEAIVRRVARVPFLDVLRRHRHLLIVGAPGSGKTTLIAHLATRAAEGGLFEGENARQDVLPFVLTVRTFTTGKITPESITKLADCDEQLVQHALTTGQALLLVDGIDEAPGNMAPQILQSLVQLRKAYPKTSIVITSRPSGIARDQGHELPDFASAELLTLTRDEVNSFIDKWCLAAELSVSSDAQVAERKAQEAAADLKQRLERSRPIQRLVETPLLATILCVVHRFLGHRIPEHCVTLYEKCTDALLYEWDHSKFGHAALVGELDALAKRQLLSGLAHRMHERKQAEVPEAEVLAHFKQALPDLGHKASGANKIVEEIRDRSGVLVERRPGFFAFSHLVFQEYLTALAYAPHHYEELLNHYEDPWWQEVIALAAGTPGADAGRLVNELLRREGPAAIFLAAQCLETAVKMPLEIREEIEQRLSELIPPKTVDDSWKLADLGVVVAPALTKALSADLNLDEARNTLHALAFIDYEPAISALARLATDSDRSSTLKDIQASAMLVLAYKSLLSSRLAKSTFIASVPKMLPGEAITLATWLKQRSEASSTKNRQRAIFQELLEALPAWAKKGSRQGTPSAKAGANSGQAPANKGP